MADQPTLHLWWARRPVAVGCRVVLCAALQPDPACLLAFRPAAARIIAGFAGQVLAKRAVTEACSPTVSVSTTV